jgi:hypothetical protein
MTEESSENVVQEIVTEETVEVVQPVEPVIEPTLPPVQTVVEPVQKKKRPRSEKQIKALENARRNKAAKRNNKPVKVERTTSSYTEEEYSFSWTKEIAKVGCLAALGLGSVFVQQQFAQNQKSQQPVVAVDVKPSVNHQDDKPTLKRPKTSSQDPFGSYR